MKPPGLSKAKLREWLAHGQGLVEYALLLALLVIVIIVIMAWLGDIVFVNYYSKIGSTMISVNH